MPLDPTIALQGQPVQQPNGLAGIAAPIQTAQGLLALRQNSMQLQANQAISQAYQQAVDPTTGQVDFGKLQTLAAQNGAGAYLPQFMGQIAQQRNSQLQYQTGQLDLALKQQQSLRGMIGSLALDPRMGKEDMSSAIAGQISDAVGSGLLPLARGVQEMSSIPSDPSAQSQWIQNHLINSLSGEAKIQAMMPENVAVQNGQGTVLFNRNRITGQMTPGTFVQSQLSPQDLNSPMTIIGPNGEQRQITKAQWLQMQGGGAPGAGVGGGSAAPGGVPGGYTGRYMPSQGAADGSAAPGVQTSLSPAQQAAMTAQGASSNTAAQSLHDAAADAPMRVNLLENARDALHQGVDGNGNPITTGPGSNWRNTAESFVNSLAPGVAKQLGWTGQVQSYDEFKKILTNYASSVSGSLGTGTDARLNAAVTGNANPDISNLANDDILTKTIAAEKMRAAQDYAFQQSGLTTDKFNQWQAQWNKAVDPQTFVFASMTPDQQQQFINRQSPQQLQQFKANLGNLVRSGVIQLPQQQPAASAAPAAAAPAPAQPPVTAASGAPS